MKSMTTCNASDIPPVERVALEHLLGTLLTDSQQVVVAVFTPGVSNAVTRAAAVAREDLQKTFAAQAARAAQEGITAEEADAAVDEAMRHVRPHHE